MSVDPDVRKTAGHALSTHELYRTVGREHLNSERPHRGDPAWLVLVECADGRFFLEAEFGEWPHAEGVSRPRVTDAAPDFFPDRPGALRRAAELIAREFGTDAARWLEEAGIRA